MSGEKLLTQTHYQKGTENVIMKNKDNNNHKSEAQQIRWPVKFKFIKSA